VERGNADVVAAFLLFCSGHLLEKKILKKT
jgi:hypothetical protein